MDNNVKKLLDRLNFEEYGYPYTDIGCVMFLKELDIELEVYGGKFMEESLWRKRVRIMRSGFIT